MMRAETQENVDRVRKSLALLAQRMDWETAPHRLEEFNALIEQPDLWNDPPRAQKLMRERQSLMDQVNGYRLIEAGLTDNIGLIELGEAEGEETIVAEAETALKALVETAAQKELEALLNGEADGNDTFLEINAGAGGTESQDWAEMLARMYTRWAERRGFAGGDAVGNPRRRGRGEIGGLQDRGAQCLWLAEDRVGRAPAGADFALRFGRQAADLLRLGLGLSGGRRQHRDRGAGQGYPHRHLPVVGRRRPARQQDRLGGADHPLPHGNSW
jgi:hypothetical protein